MNTLKQKWGPLPVWGWLALITVVLLGYWLLARNKSGAASSGAGASDTAPEVVVTGGDPGPAGPAGPPGPPGQAGKPVVGGPIARTPPTTGGPGTGLVGVQGVTPPAEPATGKTARVEARQDARQEARQDARQEARKDARQEARKDQSGSPPVSGGATDGAPAKVPKRPLRGGPVRRKNAPPAKPPARKRPAVSARHLATSHPAAD